MIGYRTTTVMAPLDGTSSVLLDLVSEPRSIPEALAVVALARKTNADTIRRLLSALTNAQIVEFLIAYTDAYSRRSKGVSGRESDERPAGEQRLAA